jgi:cell division protein FtsQ
MSRRAIALSRSVTPPSAGVSVPADRRFRRAEARPGRRPVLRFAVRATAFALVAAAAVGAVVWAGQAMVDSRYFRVTRIVVDGATRLSASDVEALVADLRGRSILRIDFDVYRRRLLDSPWVKDVRFARRLPGAILVTMQERQPMAIARLGQQLYLVDADGVITDQYGPQYADLDFPIVDGLLRQPAGGDAPVDADRLQLVARLIAATATRPELQARISHVDVSNARDAVVLLDADPVRLHLGDTRFVERLTTYLDVAPALAQQYAAIDYADLRFDDRLFVKPKPAK